MSGARRFHRGCSLRVLNLTEGRILGPAPVGSKVPIAPGYPAVSRSALSRQCHEARGRILRVGELGGPREYRRDIKAAWERVQAVPSRTFEASLGPVEYALEGEGPPLLMSHGIQGSHVEGIRMVGTYVGTGWMGIAQARQYRPASGRDLTEC